MVDSIDSIESIILIVGWDLNTVIRTIIHMFRKIDERLNC